VECSRQCKLVSWKSDHINQRLGGSFITRAHQMTYIRQGVRLLPITEFYVDKAKFGRLTSRPFSPDYAVRRAML
jgi:hypothetical protein